MTSKNLTHQKLGKLKIIANCGTNTLGEVLCVCDCDCGNSLIVKDTKYLSQSSTPNCGCITKKNIAEFQTKYGLSLEESTSIFEGAQNLGV